MSEYDPPNLHDLAVRTALLEQSHSALRDELHKINANLSRLVWAAAIALVGGVIQFVIRGGLAGS